jgi:predicted negative regulator of RcsB-dependent stress response
VRYTRQALKQDKFAEGAADAVHWTVEHRSKLTTGAVVLVVLIALVAGGWWYMNHREDQANIALGKAMQIYNAPLRPADVAPDPQITSFSSIAERAKAAKPELDKVASGFSSTRSGQFARYFSALAENDMGNTQGAEQALKAATDSKDADVASLSKFALAGFYHTNNRDADAIKLYKELIEKPTLTVPKTTAQFSLADLYEATQPDEARKMYEQIAKDDPKGAAGQIAASKRQAMKQ